MRLPVGGGGGGSGGGGGGILGGEVGKGGKGDFVPRNTFRGKNALERYTFYHHL